ncbi:MAG: Gfo/Idh/MocA family oxidoreductase, partial [Bacteroidota bacterium]
MQRRKFLRRSAQAAASLYLPTLIGCSSSPEKALESATAKAKSNDAKKKLGVALLGLGGYSRGQLAPALQLTEHCELRGIITGTPAKIPVWQNKYNIPDANVYNYDNMAEIANNPAIDVIYVVTPTATHARFAIAAANAGKHVWCEKPMAMTPEECKSIIDACNKNGVELTIGYRMQHEPNTQTVIEYANTLPYGSIQSITAHSGYGGSIPRSGWRSEAKMGGGALYDMGVYAINALRYASQQEPVSVLSAKREVPLDVDVTTTFELEFPGDFIAKGKTSVVENTNFLRIEAEKGWYELSPMQSYGGVVGQTSDGTQLNKPIRNQQARQMDN